MKPSSPTAWNVADIVVYGLISLFGLGICAIVAVVLIVGQPYYVLAETVRPDHPLHPWLKPGGVVGLWLGIGGAGLMTAMLSYSVRKALLSWHWLGPPHYWFAFHILCGVMGPILIVIHTAFRWPSGYIAVGFWAMVLVALSGVFGRFVYGHFPRTARGRSQSLEDGLEQLAQLRADLVRHTRGAHSKALTHAVEVVRRPVRPTHTVVDWLRLHLLMRQRSAKVRRLLRKSQLPADTLARAQRDLEAQLWARQGLAGWEATATLFKWWHLFHEPLAKSMYILAALHILEAIIIGGALLHLWGPT